MSLAPEVEFTPEAVRKFLDDGIRHWEGFRNEALQLGYQMNAHRAAYYIDCLRKVKIALLGEEEK